MALDFPIDEAKATHLCQMFDLASSPDNNIQQQVRQALDQFSSQADFNLYLVTVFAKMTAQPEVVRQRAGLLLKTNLSRSSHIDAQVAQYVQSAALCAVQDPNQVVRHTAGTVITTIVNKIGIQECRQTLDRLAGLLTEGNAEAMEGSFNALNKICEDIVGGLNQFWDAPAEFTQPFVSWCAERLLPKIFDLAVMNAPLHARQNAIECLNHFALSHMFHDSKYPAFQQFSQRYVKVLGNLAQDTDTAVLRDVCKGFVCVIENSWVCDNGGMCEVVLKYMLKASQHPEYAVRLEALEVWTPCTHTPMMLQLVRPMLPELVPVLLGNMKYSEADFLCMDGIPLDDDGAVPDRDSDFAPRFHKGQTDNDDDDAEEGNNAPGGAWGSDWTARKAAASALDNLANAFRTEILQVVLPLIQANLDSSAWDVQESGVLALGAISIGCMKDLVPYLEKVMELLLKLCDSPKPLVRSISCWAASRYSAWICHEQTERREQILRAVLQALMRRILDTNKRVQEAACSAFATLEEEARWQLAPYLDDIVHTLVKAFQCYQDKNLLILYDASGTLASAVGSELAQPKYIAALIPPIMLKFEQVPDNGRTLLALFECLSHLTHNMGEQLLPVIPRIVERCVRLVGNATQQAKAWQQNPTQVDKPDREAVAASIDLLSSIVEGLQGRVVEVLAQQNFICIVPEVLKTPTLQVKQSAYALVGDCAKNCHDYLMPFLPEIIPLCAASLREHTSATVSNNASWSIGEICVKVGDKYMSPYMDDVLQALVSVLQRQRHMPQQAHLMQNICITLGRLGVVSGTMCGKAFGEFAQVWCEVMMHVMMDHEKLTAFMGLINMVKANPQACMGCIPQLASALVSCTPVPPQMSGQFQEILNSYKQALGANWPAVYATFPEHVKTMATHLYNLGP